MNVNPLQLLKIKGMLDTFRRNHPKVFPFIDAAVKRIEEGSIIELKVTAEDGKTMVTNIRVNREDMELLRQINEFTRE